MLRRLHLTRPSTRHAMALSLTFVACSPPADTAGGAMATGGSSSSSTTESPPADQPTDPTTSSTSSSSASTTEASTTTTSTTGDATTGTPSLCGNGVVDPGEMCDLSWQNNSDLGYCKTDCTLATCGDGDLWVGVEACDEGPGGNTGAYAGCMPDCSLANFCGDGLPHPTEACDAGEANGTGQHEEGFVTCSATCNLDAYRVFISSIKLTGNLGGITGADQTCKNLAIAAGWAEESKVRAWLSNDSVSAMERVTGPDPDKPYALVNGKRITDNLAELGATGVGDGIDLDELGNPWIKAEVWTNTAVTGEPFDPPAHCQGWISASPGDLARIGLNARPKLPKDEWTDWSVSKKWTSYDTMPCVEFRHIYCFEL